MSKDIRQTIESDVQSHPILVYMKGEKEMPQCGFSNAVVQVLTQLNVPFETRNVLADENLRQAIKDYSNWPTIPQVYVGGQFIGGCDIVVEMYQKGELEPLVSQALGGGGDEAA